MRNLESRKRGEKNRTPRRHPGGKGTTGHLGPASVPEEYQQKVSKGKGPMVAGYPKTAQKIHSVTNFQPIYSGLCEARPILSLPHEVFGDNHWAHYHHWCRASFGKGGVSAESWQLCDWVEKEQTETVRNPRRGHSCPALQPCYHMRLLLHGCQAGHVDGGQRMKQSLPDEMDSTNTSPRDCGNARCWRPTC